MTRQGRTTRSLTIATMAIMALFALTPTRAIEFGFEGQSGNLQFPWALLTPTPGVGPFPSTNYWYGGNAFVGFPIGDEASLRLDYELDPVLRNVVTAAVQFERGIARISVGPFFGLFNTTAAPFSAGISTSIRFQWPGVAYVSVRSDGALSIGALADALGSEPQARAEIAAGFYTRNAIVSAVLGASSFSQNDSGGLTVTDALSSYMITIDLFKKNIPYTLMAEAGYEVRSKYYEASSVTDALGSLVIGLKATVEPSPGWRILASFRSGVFVFGMDALTGRSPDQGNLFYLASLGLSFDTEKLAHLAKARGDEAEAEAATATEAAPDKEGAARPAGSWTFDGGFGLSYNLSPLPPGPFALLAALFNTRAGLSVDATYRFKNGLGLGGETGLDFISVSFDGGVTSASIFDLPLRAKASWVFGPVTAEVFTGLMTTGVVLTGYPFAIGFSFDAGIGARLGAFYLDASYVIPSGGTAYPRVGAGFMLDLAKLFKGRAKPEAGATSQAQPAPQATPEAGQSAAASAESP